MWYIYNCYCIAGHLLGALMYLKTETPILVISVVFFSLFEKSIHCSPPSFRYHMFSSILNNKNLYYRPGVTKETLTLFMDICLIDFIDILHSQTKLLFKCSFFFHFITSCCRCVTFLEINSKTSQVDQNQGLFPVYLCFLQKSRTFQGLEFYFSNSRSFPVFEDLWEPC